MDLSNINTTTHILKPTWPRLLHRMHTLGTIRHRYHNDVASISSEGEYPRLVTTPHEEKSIAINGNHQWIFDNWKQVTVRVAAKYQRADFVFTAENGEVFHEISLTAKSQWDCFECLLKIFENTSSNTPNLALNTQLETVSTFNKINSNITQVAKAVNREIIRGKKVICSIPLAGTSLLKDLEFKSLMTQFGTAALKKQHSQLTLNSKNICFHEIIQRPNQFTTTLFNADAEPLLRIQAV
jgi:hypothetical protein